MSEKSPLLSFDAQRIKHTVAFADHYDADRGQLAAFTAGWKAAIEAVSTTLAEILAADRT